MGVGTGTKTGFILLDSSSSNSPYIDIYGRNSNTYTDYTIHGRFGWLKGITDADVGLATTDVWGLYTDNAYIKGVVVANTGYIGGTTGWVIAAGSISSVNTGNTTTMASGGTNAYIAGTTGTPQFIVTHAGALIASSATITGAVNATSGKFGTATNYWSVGANGLTAVSASTDVMLNYGKTDFDNTQIGFILGYDFSASKPKIYIGTTTNYFDFDGTNIELVGGEFKQGKLSEQFTAGDAFELGDAVVIGDGSDMVLTGQGATDDTELICPINVGNEPTFYAQPIKFHKNFVAGDTFKVELNIKATGSLDNACQIQLRTDVSKSPRTGVGNWYEISYPDLLEFRNFYKKITTTITISAGHSIDKDTIYWLIFAGGNDADEYRLKSNTNLYYEYYTRKEFASDSDYVLKKKKGIGDGYTSEGCSGEMYFKILIPTTSGRAYRASSIGVGDDFSKIAIGLSNNIYASGVTMTCITGGILSGCTVIDHQNIGDNVYLNYYGGKVTGDPTDILRSYAIGQTTSVNTGVYGVKLNIESNLLLRADI